MKKKIVFISVLSIVAVIAVAVCLLSVGTGAVSFSSTYQNELWMLAGEKNVLCRGDVIVADSEHPDAAPYMFMGETMTAYVPIDALISYHISMTQKYASCKVDADGLGAAVKINMKNGTSRQYHLVFDSLECEGLSSPLTLPPVYKDGTVYISLTTASKFFDFSVFQNTDISLLIFSTVRMSYNAGYDSTISQLYTVQTYLTHQQITDTQLSEDVDAFAGLTSHPRLIATDDKFDELRALYGSKLPSDADAAASLYYSRVKVFVADADYRMKTYFTTDPETGKVIWATRADGTSAALDYRQPYYLYDENGNRLVGKTSYTYTDGDDVYKYYLKAGTDKVYEDGEGKTVHEIYEKKVGGYYSSGLGDGYRSDGRSTPSNWTTHMLVLAYAWQLTGDSRYAEGFYLMAKAMGEWEHWGDGHFLNCADGATLYALGYDWIYHAFDAEPEKRHEMAKILYDKCVMMGYLSAVTYQGRTDYKNFSGMHYSASQGAGVSIYHRDNNWNSVCSCGVILSALCCMEYPDMRANSNKVAATLLNQLDYYTFEYAPDGAFCESPSYWAYATSTLMRIIGALKTSAGTDYGYLNTIGLQESYYFCAYMCDSNYQTWNYHDASRSTLSDGMNYLAATLYNDPGIAKIRDIAIFEKRVSSMDVFDLVTYVPGFSDSAEEMDLDYLADSLETVTLRSSWDNGAIFTGLHAGENDIVHGDADSGNFYLEMGGVLWFGDPGAEDYGVRNYFSRSTSGTYNRYRYYKKNPEGHNTIVINSMPYGQIINSRSSSYAKITNFVTDEYGGIGVADMTPQYGQNCISGTRAVMLTNSRTTVVVQDEISFRSQTDLTWLADPSGTVLIPPSDPRTAYITASNGKILRATLLTDDPALSFSLIGTPVLSKTFTSADVSAGYATPSDPQLRLAVSAKGVTSFSVAVVFEIVETKEEAVGYKKVPISEWKTDSDEWLKAENQKIIDEKNKVYPYTSVELRRAMTKIEEEKDFATLGAYLRDAAKYLSPDAFNPTEKLPGQLLPKLREYIADYNKAINQNNKKFLELFGSALSGN